MLASIVRVLALALMLTLLAASRILALDVPGPALGEAFAPSPATPCLSSLPLIPRG
jgi:hypothetical protein